MWQGWTKNLYPLMGGNLKSLLVEVAEASFRFRRLCCCLPCCCFTIAGIATIPVAAIVGVIVGMLIGRGLHHMAALYRNLYPVSYIQYYVPGLWVYSAALIVSWWKSTQGTVVWKGREYAAKTS